MSMLNDVQLMGRLTRDPDLRYTPQGTAVVNFTLAVERKTRKDAEKKADFIDIVAWRGTAEFVAKYFVKGQLVVVRGSIQTRTYEKDGINRKVTEVNAEEVFFAEKKREGQPEGNLPEGFEEVDCNDDELPF